MKLRWPGLSNPERQFEAWIAQRYREQVLRGSYAPPGPCPDEAFLKALAKQSTQVQLTDPRVEHAANCQMCTRRLIEFRRVDHSRRIRITLVTAVSCLLIVGIVIVLQRRFATEHSRIASLQNSSQTLDLFSAGSFRGSQPGQLQSVSLPAALVRVTVILPRYSEVGRYAVAVTHDQTGGSLVARGEGVAVAKNNQQQVSVYLDLRTSQAGSYFLSTTHEQDQASYYYPLQIK